MRTLRTFRTVTVILTLLAVGNAGRAFAIETQSTAVSVQQIGKWFALTQSACIEHRLILKASPSDTIGPVCSHFAVQAYANCLVACNPWPDAASPCPNSEFLCSVPPGHTGPTPCDCWNACWFQFLQSCPQYGCGSGGN
jgi:hypothetical protein